MLTNIIFILLIVFLPPLSVHAEELNEVRIPCEGVDLIEIYNIPGMDIKMSGMNGNCNGGDCYTIGVRLTEKEATVMQAQARFFICQPYDIYIGTEKMISNYKLDFIPPVKLFSIIGENAAYASFEEAKTRAIEICPDRPVKYAGILGERPKPD